MEKKVFVALADAIVRDAIAKHSESLALARGKRGISGRDGESFELENHKEEILNFVTSNFELSEELASRLKGERGQSGRDGVDGKDGRDGLDGKDGVEGKDGRDGKDFEFDSVREEINETVISFVKSLSDTLRFKFEDFTPEQLADLKGAKGKDGRAGKDFDFTEHAYVIRQQLAEEISANYEKLKLKFSDLTEEEKLSLKGKDGVDGKGFIFEEHAEAIYLKIAETITNVKVRFSDLTSDQVESLRGPAGLRGKDGKDFNYEEHEDSIVKVLDKTIEQKKNDLKLKFSDLTDKEVESLRGPAGLRGKDGKDFNYEEHEDKISQSILKTVEDKKQELKLKFTDLTEEEVESLKGEQGPKGRDGRNFSFEESYEGIAEILSKAVNSVKDDLRFKYENFTDEQLESIRGPKGARGQKGTRGEKGEQGEQGPKGKDGISRLIVTRLPGIQGRQGTAGRDGKDGMDAPTVSSVSVLEPSKGRMAFRFDFTDGSVLVTNDVKLPEKPVYQQIFASSYAISEGGNSNIDKGLIEVDCEPSVYVGAAVRMLSDGTAVNAIATSRLTSNVLGIVEEIVLNRAKVRVMGVTPDIFTGLDVTKDYFLSDSVAGEITTVVPTDPGHVKIKLGQPASTTAFIVLKGERTGRI